AQPLLLAGLFLPIAGLAALDTMRWRTLLGWLAAAFLFIGCVGVHAALRGAAVPAPKPEPLFGPSTFFATAAMLFIAQALVAAGDSERRPIAAYRTYFDAAWKQEMQLLLSLGFL